VYPAFNSLYSDVSDFVCTKTTFTFLGSRNAYLLGKFSGVQRCRGPETLGHGKRGTDLFLKGCSNIQITSRRCSLGVGILTLLKHLNGLWE
jgi:hypothetical protein